MEFDRVIDREIDRVRGYENRGKLRERANEKNKKDREARRGEVEARWVASGALEPLLLYDSKEAKDIVEKAAKSFGLTARLDKGTGYLGMTPRAVGKEALAWANRRATRSWGSGSVLAKGYTPPDGVKGKA